MLYLLQEKSRVPQSSNMNSLIESLQHCPLGGKCQISTKSASTAAAIVPRWSQYAAATHCVLHLHSVCAAQLGRCCVLWLTTYLCVAVSDFACRDFVQYLVVCDSSLGLLFWPYHAAYARTQVGRQQTQPTSIKNPLLLFTGSFACCCQGQDGCSWAGVELVQYMKCRRSISYARMHWPEIPAWSALNQDIIKLRDTRSCLPQSRDVWTRY